MLIVSTRTESSLAHFGGGLMAGNGDATFLQDYRKDIKGNHPLKNLRSFTELSAQVILPPFDRPQALNGESNIPCLQLEITGQEE